MPLTANVLNKYLSPVFIETGTHGGDGVMQAIMSGFRTIASIESDKMLADLARTKFQNNPNVTIYHGDSAVTLDLVIKKFACPVTLWLDAHGPGILTVTNCPLAQEIRAGLQYATKYPVIFMIDDLRILDPNLRALVDYLFQYSGYDVTYEDSPIAAQDILVATKKVPV